MGKKKDQMNNLGRSVIKSRFAKTHKSPNTFLHTTELPDGYDWGRLNLASVTEQSNLADFLSTAEMAGTEFIAEKMNVMVVDPGTETGLPGSEALREVRQIHQQQHERLKIPRRPKWNETTSGEELDRLERESFIEWRRDLALLQEEHNVILTPYEKNLEFWRQLWRVIERSDVIVQIVDARNPLLFYCEDLVKYVAEVDAAKLCVVLINKADLLTAPQRKFWLEYFKSRGIKAAFWSALGEAARLKANENAEEEAVSLGDAWLDSESSGIDDNEAEDSEADDSERDGVDGDFIELDATSGEVSDKTVEHSVDADEKCSGDAAQDVPGVGVGDGTRRVDSHSDGALDPVITMSHDPGGMTSDLLTVDQLLSTLRCLTRPLLSQPGAVATIGMVGYPNVGKSSTINTILQTKKVPVSATPGRTKHFQTLYVEEDLMLCDCPGLVFPSFVTTKAELIVNGVLPIDQMREHIPPVSLVCFLVPSPSKVCQRIPRPVLCRVYGIMLPAPGDTDDPDRPPTAHEMLSAYALMRGYMTHKGLPDGPRASRHILKDYVNGKLVYCHPPPGIDPSIYRPTASCLTYLATHNKRIKDKELCVDKSISDVQEEIDKEFFHQKHQHAHVMGGPSGQHALLPGPHRPTAGQGVREKPWRVKEKRSHKKREKLRRVYRDLDIH